MDEQERQLKELIATHPRAISHRLSLAEYLFTHNRMEEAAREFRRARELASLPAPRLPAAATDVERQQAKTAFDKDCAKVKAEIERHTVNAGEHFDHALNLDQFQTTFQKLASEKWDIHNFEWVADEAEKHIHNWGEQYLQHRQRAVELFSDSCELNPESVAPRAGLAWAYLSAWDKQGVAILKMGIEDMKGKRLGPVDKDNPGRTWRLLGNATLQAYGQDDIVQTADQIFEAGEEFAAKNKYEHARLLCAHARVAPTFAHTLDTGRMAEAVALVKDSLAEATAPEIKARNLALLLQVELELAGMKINQGRWEEAEPYVKDIIARADPENEMRKEAQKMMDDHAATP